MGKNEGEAHEEYWCLRYGFTFILPRLPRSKPLSGGTLSGVP